MESPAQLTTAPCSVYAGLVTHRAVRDVYEGDDAPLACGVFAGTCGAHFGLYVPQGYFREAASVPAPLVLSAAEYSAGGAMPHLAAAWGTGDKWSSMVFDVLAEALHGDGAPTPPGGGDGAVKPAFNPLTCLVVREVLGRLLRTHEMAVRCTAIALVRTFPPGAVTADEFRERLLHTVQSCAHQPVALRDYVTAICNGSTAVWDTFQLLRTVVVDVCVMVAVLAAGMPTAVPTDVYRDCAISLVDGDDVYYSQHQWQQFSTSCDDD